MRKLYLVVCVGLLLSLGGAKAFAQADLTKPIKQMIDGFNSNDVKAVVAAYASGDISITDEVPPFHWSGTKANDEWLAALEKHDKAAGISDGKVKFGSVVHSETEGDAAYVVTAVSYAFQQKGKTMTESARMTFVLHKEGGAWKIAGWVWSGTKPREAKTSG